MQQLTFLPEQRFEWREAPTPVLGSDHEAIVRPVAVATCDLDRLIVLGVMAVDRPLPFGHECVAEVVDIGDAVTSVRPGDLVSVPFQVSCGQCGTCLRGHTGNCETTGPMAMYGLPGNNQGGFLSDVVRVPFADAMLVPIPAGISAESVASLSDNIADAWRTVGPALAEQPGAPVLIAASSASIALYATAIALALGAERVDIVGGNSFLRGKAEALGANLLDKQFPRKAGTYPITVDASSDVAGLQCALRSTEAEGVCTSIGIYFTETTSLPLLEMYMSGIRFHTGRAHARTAMEPALELVRTGRLRPELVTGETASWDDAADAVAAHRSKLVISRPTLTPSGSQVPA
ncbi:alcohol dehydrogenase catalytic domain-containing protein [Nocardia altamirensis]|uniref:alcohol dehydrogenase catalytic domain-containing protein n=1 Tax=Nocardia altamirensis TaxID=472158 RepID=UPI00083FDD26|nr:alcohol dehydrogenase catalytic domain-containing protein [Nocardia altamirensis]